MLNAKIRREARELLKVFCAGLGFRKHAFTVERGAENDMASIGPLCARRGIRGLYKRVGECALFKGAPFDLAFDI